MTGLHYEIGTHRQFNDNPQRLAVFANPAHGDPRRVVIRAPPYPSPSPSSPSSTTTQ